MVTTQVAVPVHPPPAQVTKVEPVAAAALRDTGVPSATGALHVVPQLIPTGKADVTVPEPVPARVTVSTR